MIEGMHGGLSARPAIESRIVLELLRSPALILERNGDVSGSNRRGTAVLGRQRGLLGVKSHRSLRFTNRAVDSGFLSLAKRFHASEHGEARAHVVPKVIMEMTRMSCGQRAVLTLRTPLDGCGWDVDEIAGILGITGKQASFAHALLAGRNLDEIATDQGVTIFGVKWHLTQLLRAFKCRSQADLVRTLCGLLG